MNKNLPIGTPVVYSPSKHTKKYGHVVETTETRTRVKWYKETWDFPSGNHGERAETKRTWIRNEALMVVPKVIDTFEAKLTRLLPDLETP